MSGRSGGCYSAQPETLTSFRVVSGYRSLSPLSIVAPTFSLDKFDNNVAPVIGQRGKEHSDWPASSSSSFFFNCVHLSSLFQISSVKNLKGVPGKAKIDAVHPPTLKKEFYRFYTIARVAQFIQL